MRAAVKSWTPQETELAKSLIEQGATNEMFLSLMGRTRRCAESRLRRVQDSFGHIMASGHYAGDGNIKVPPEVWEDRNRRLNAKQTMSPAAIIMGDPEPIRRRL